MSPRHLLSASDLTRDEATAILDDADRFSESLLGREVKKLPTLRGRTVITMFYENSTRTRVSFEVAGKWMSADVINVSSSGSSVAKGESLRDTALDAARGRRGRADHPPLRIRGGAAARRVDGHRGRRSVGDQRRRRHPRTSDPGAARRADHPPAARRHRGQAGGDRRRHPAQPGGPVQRPAAAHAGRRGGAGGAADAAARRGGGLAGDRVARPGRRAARRRRGADAAGAGRADDRRVLPVGPRVLGAATGCRRSGRRCCPATRWCCTPDRCCAVWRSRPRSPTRRNRLCCNRFPTVCISGWRCCSTCWWAPIRRRSEPRHERSSDPGGAALRRG